MTPLKLIAKSTLRKKQSEGFVMRLEFIQIIDRLPESDCKDLCTNFRGRKSLHDHSLKTVKISVHCTQIFTLCKDLHCKDLRPPTVPFSL